MERKFFNILDSNIFTNQTEFEQKKSLIKLGVYVKGEYCANDFIVDETYYWRAGADYPKFMGHSFEMEEINYNLNINFLNEVFDECMHSLNTRTSNLIESRIETMQLQFEIVGMSIIKDNLIKQSKHYSDALTGREFKILHKIGFENEQLHFDFLKKYLSISWYDLSDYICGLNNIKNYDVVELYSKYLTLNKILNFLNSVDSIDNFNKNSKFIFGHSSKLVNTNVDKNFQQKSPYIPKIKMDGANRIIKDDYILLYAYIVDNYEDIKNNAFFSYLFHFLSINKFLLKNTKSSTLYNEFLIKNELLETFSKVIQRIENGGEGEDRMFESFKISMKEYNKLHID